MTPSFYSDTSVVDEIKMYCDGGYLSAREVIWRIYTFDINHREPVVERHSFHFPNEQVVVFSDNVPTQDVLDKPHIHNMKFSADGCQQKISKSKIFD